MKSTICARRLRGGRTRPKAGVALILVLAALAILTGLVVAFFIAVTNDQSTSRVYAVGVESRKLGDEALNIAVAQIRDATSHPDQAWISQPGLIRTFDTTGKLVTAYKLYSASQLKEDLSFDPSTTSDSPPPDWHASPALFTDLNAPAFVSDPAGDTVISGERYAAIYPIVDPSAAADAASNPNGVKGFAVSNAPLDSGANANPAPMPVRWLYMLRDGTIATASGAGPIVTVTGASDSNPIVGRFAFWTDDDSCKVNINTACGDLWEASNAFGSFTDMPHAATAEERLLAANQPVKGEFQRYPGHPATTYLSAVFPFLSRADLGAIVPRVLSGGSLGGTQASGTAINPADDVDRLYASVDELVYSPSFTPGAPGSRVANGSPLMDAKTIAKAHFFLTAHSRSPEVNLFNRPRVAIWPEPSDPGKRSIFDKTIAFCTTVGGSPFYFVRNNASSSTSDYETFQRNKELYQYLLDLTGDAPYGAAIPGFGGSFKSKYGNDRAQILTEIFDYIRCTNLADPTQPVANRFAKGPATPLALPYCPAGTGQVVPIEITPAGSAVETRGFGRMPTVHSPTLFFYPTKYVPNKASEPQNWGSTQGVRTLFMIEPFTTSHGVMRLLPNLVYEVEGLDAMTLDGMPMGFPAKARLTYCAVSPYHDYGWGSLEGAANLFWPAAGTPGPKTLGTDENTSYTLFSSKVALNKPVNPEYVNQEGQFGSYLTIACPSDIIIRAYSRDNTTNAVSSNPIQVLKFRFPTTSAIPTPRVRTGNPGTLPSEPTDPPLTAAYIPAEDFSKRMHSTAEMAQDTYSMPGDATKTTTLYENDALRSVSPLSGDARLIAGMKNVPASAFAKDADYDRQVLYASPARSGNGVTFGNGRFGKLVDGADYNDYYYSANYFPAVPSFVQGAMLVNSAGGQSPGDWDTGMGSTVDGPYINKPDEGETGGGDPYFTYDGIPVQTTKFSPNRQVPSPVIFGSLSTTVKASQAAMEANNLSGVRPWQTLLFCANPAAKQLHPGMVTPPDHLFLDLFTMPVVEPYPISEPFSTAGKINLNYQIVPFPYITRSTGIQAVLRSVKIGAIPTSDAHTYKTDAQSSKYRVDVDLDETIKGFEDRFKNNKPFISSSEICEMFLVPKGATLATVSSWWDSYLLTGDNMREKPYADIYSRLTTKSNTFTVHVRAQSLQKRKLGGPASEWKEGADIISSEYRGSFTLERYLDPNISAYDSSQPLLDYKFRVIDSKQFNQ